MSNILKKLGYSSRNRNVRTALKQLVEQRLVVYTIPDKPKSKKQAYEITPEGVACLASNNS